MKIQESGEMYLETLLLLSKQGNTVHAVDIANALGYSKPSVSRALGILAKNDYITVEQSGAIHFTDKGKEYAENIYERHEVLTSFFVSLGVSKLIAESDACKVEHVISPELYQTIKQIVDKQR